MKFQVVVAASLVLMSIHKVESKEVPQHYVNRQRPMTHMAGLLQLIETIPLQTVGYMDHLGYDLKGEHLFISGETNKEMVVVDLNAEESST